MRSGYLAAEAVLASSGAAEILQPDLPLEGFPRCGLKVEPRQELTAIKAKMIVGESWLSFHLYECDLR